VGNSVKTSAFFAGSPATLPAAACLMDVQDASAAASAWKSSNESFIRICRWSFIRHMPSWCVQSRNETCQRTAPGSCAAQAFPNFTCSLASQDCSHGPIPTLLLHTSLAPALSCYTLVPHNFTCLLQVFHQPFVKPKAVFASWNT